MLDIVVNVMKFELFLGRKINYIASNAVAISYDIRENLIYYTNALRIV